MVAMENPICIARVVQFKIVAVYITFSLKHLGLSEILVGVLEYLVVEGCM